MKLGLDTYCYHHAAGLYDWAPRRNQPMELGHFLRKAAELGLDGLQLSDPRHLDSLDYGYITEVRRQADSLGLYLELGTSGTNSDHLQNMVRAAHVLGSPVVRTFVGGQRSPDPERLEQTLAAAAAQLREVVPVCERYRVALAIENHQDLTTPELLRLVESLESDWVGVCFDTGNPLAVMEDPMDSARAFGRLVTSVHLKDYQVAARSDGFSLVGCALGEGVVDLRGILDLLHLEAPGANLNIEAYVGKHVVAALEDEYLRQFPRQPARALGRTLRLVRDRGLPREPVLPTERGASEEEVLEAEEELVVRSVQWAEAALGRAGGEARDGDVR